MPVAHETIIVIDDEEELTQLLKIELEAEGFTVLTAQDGKTGIDLAQKNSPDLIILDIMMPGLNGYETLQELRNNSSTQNIPILMLSSKGLDGDIQKGLDLGVDDYITKPFHAGLLIKRIRALLRKKQ